MRQIRGKGFAKLNLYLDICGRRADGYHELTTVFQSVDRYDSVALRTHRNGGISLRCNLPYLPTDGRNLAVKAAALFFAEAGIDNPGLYINIRKEIPVGAGMAGGSTDAARVLERLNRMYGSPLNGPALHRAAVQLGADVPFCLTGGAALAGGIGERLEPLRPLPACWIVVGKPSFSVSTKTAYELFDRQETHRPVPPQRLLSGLERGELKGVCKGLYNALEEPVMGQYPAIGRIKARLEDQGALGALMTGSGSAVFGIFEEKQAAQQAAEALRELTRTVFVTRPEASGKAMDRTEE